MTPAERARHELRKQIIEEGEKGNWKPLYDARAKGFLHAEEARQLRHDVQLGPVAARVDHFKYSEMGIRFTHPAATSCGFRLSSAPAIVV